MKESISNINEILLEYDEMILKIEELEREKETLEKKIYSILLTLNLNF